VTGWRDVLDLAGTYGGQELADGVVVFELPVDESATRHWKVFFFHDVVKPDMEFVRLSSPVGELRRVDAAQLLREFGTLTIGALQFNQSDTGGFVCLGTSLPLQFLDIDEPLRFMLFATVFARTAHNIARHTGFAD
jgi:hypothetical protein